MLQALRTATLLKRDSKTGFSCEFCELFKKIYFVYRIYERLILKHQCAFLRHLFYRSSPVVVSDSFRFPAFNFVKNETPAKTFFFKFSKIFKNIFWQNTSEWLLLVFICKTWEVFQFTSFIEHLWETAYFMYKLQNFNHQIQ